MSYFIFLITTEGEETACFFLISINCYYVSLVRELSTSYR